MISKSSYTRNKNLPLGQEKETALVRTGSFYGLKIEGVRLENSTLKRGIISTPNFYFYDNQSKVMVDFSDFKNVIEDVLVKDFFALNLTGNTFELKNAEWLNPDLTNKKINLNGTYTFDSFKNNILFANVSSVDSIDTDLNRYDKSFFKTTPDLVFSVSASQGDTKLFSIVNYLGENSKNSFNYLGAVPGDYIKINKSNNKYEIYDLFKDEEGKEILIIKGSLTAEDRVTSITDVSLYLHNPDRIQKANYDNEKIGRCNILVNGVSQCFDSNTQYQCALRNNSKTKAISSFVQGDFCEEETAVVQRTTAVEQLTEISRSTNEILTQVISKTNFFR
jgi:hypothetical protein